MEAIQSGFQNYANFSGRASRAEFWWWALFVVVVGVVAAIVDAALGTTAGDTSGIGIVSAIVGLALILPGIAVTVRRLHDIGRSGWWLLLGLIPIIGTIVLLVFYLTPGTVGANQYGLTPATA